MIASALYPSINRVRSGGNPIYYVVTFEDEVTFQLLLTEMQMIHPSDTTIEPIMSEENLPKEKTQFKEGKIFVGGLTWDTTVEDVKKYFSKFGEVVDANIIKDPATNRSRGFGFVVFKNERSVFAYDGHYLNGKKIDTKNAFRRAVGEISCRKVFIGGVDPSLPESDIREYFSTFGEIEEIDFPWDKQKNQRRAFCFIAFTSPDVVNEVIKNSKHKLGDRMVDVKKATPRQDNNAGSANNGNLATLLNQALSSNTNSNTINPNNALLAALLATQHQSNSLSNPLSSLNSNAFLHNIPNQLNLNQPNNPYFALAAAAGIYPNSMQSLDLANYYSNIALAAAAAATHEGYNIQPSNLHRENSQSSNSHGIVYGNSKLLGGNNSMHNKMNRHGPSASNLSGRSGYHPYSR